MARKAALRPAPEHLVELQIALETAEIKVSQAVDAVRRATKKLRQLDNAMKQL